MDEEEEGKKPQLKLARSYLACIGHPETDYLYRLQPEPGLGGRVLRYPRGRVLGGCSSINGMIYMRGQQRDYDEWARMLGDESFAWDAVLPLFKRHEDHWSGTSALHGSGGEWRVEKQRVRWDVLDSFALAFQEHGVPRTADFNTGTNLGVAYFEVNQKRGTRWNARRAFLPSPQPLVRVHTHARVARVIFDGTKRACGVELAGSGERVEARREVLLCAGAIDSPAILERSGIGSAPVLRAAGVEHVLVDNPHVGEGLCDHLQIRLVFRMQHGTSLNSMYHSWWSRARMGWEYLTRQSGPLSMAPSQLGAFAPSRAGEAWPNLEWHVQPLSLDAFGEPLHRFDALTASVCNLQPTSRGSTHIASTDPAAHPIIQANYLSTEHDRQVAVDAIRLTRAVASQPAMRAYGLQEHAPGAHLQSHQDLVSAAGRIATTIFHPTSSCALGRVLDNQFRVHGVSALRVCDASAMPVITSGNTCSPTLMLAEKLAQQLQ